MAVVVSVYGKADFKQIKRAEKQLASLKKEASSGGSVWKKFGSEIAGAGKSMTLFASVPIVIGMGAAVMAASNLEEEMNKVKVVFGQSSDAVVDFSETGAKSLGMAQQEALAAAGAFGNLFKTTGLTDKASADMSMNFVKLANDMASFNNIPVAQALEKLRSGLVGEAEPLRTVGVLLSEARVQEEAYASGIAARGSVLTEAQKVQARYNLILKDTKVQQGDFERTSGSLANQLRILRASVIDMAAQFGTVLIPMIKPVVGILTGVANVLVKMPAPLRYITVGILGIVAATGPVLWGLGSMAKGLDNVRRGADIARSVLTTVPGVLGRVAGGFRDSRVAASAFSGAAGTLGGKLRSMTTMLAGLPGKINASILAMGLWVVAIAAVAAAVYLTVKAFNEWQRAEDFLNKQRAEAQSNEEAQLERVRKKYGENSDQYRTMVQKIKEANADLTASYESELTGLAGWLDGWAKSLEGASWLSGPAKTILGIVAGGTAQIAGWVGLASGGYVPATPGGLAAVLAEGGEGEYVVPESKVGRFAQAALGGGAAPAAPTHTTVIERRVTLTWQTLTGEPSQREKQRLAAWLKPELDGMGNRVASLGF